MPKSGEDLRGTGRTTRQIQQAADGAVFVWCNHALFYPRKLAAALGRYDLRIVGPIWLDSPGHRPPAVVIDHASPLSVRVSDAVQILRAHRIPVSTYPNDKET